MFDSGSERRRVSGQGRGLGNGGGLDGCRRSFLRRSRNRQVRRGSHRGALPHAQNSRIYKGLGLNNWWLEWFLDLLHLLRRSSMLDWRRLLHMARGILRVWSDVRKRWHRLCRRRRNIDLDVSNRVPFNMVRVESMTGRREKD
jgi:hypothetical protein